MQYQWLIVLKES